MRFWKKMPEAPSSTSPAVASADKAREALRAGSANESLDHLLRGFQEDNAHRPLYELAVVCLSRMGAPEEAALFQRALRHFANSRCFYDLGYHFVEIQSMNWAIPFLERARQLSPGDIETASELALAYTCQFQPGRAREVLRGVDFRGEFLPTYMYHWISLLSNDVGGIRPFIEAARASPQLAPEHRTDGNRQMLDHLEACLIRLETVPDPGPLIQNWHFIQYGSAILDYMDDEIAEGGLSVAGGRWVVVWGQSEKINQILRRLRCLLDALGRKPEIVLSLPDRNSEIIGRAAALLLGLPFLAAEETLAANRERSLVVVADNRLLETMAFSEIRNGQTLFALNQHWLAQARATPDVAGLMSQEYYFPWAGGTPILDPDTREVTVSEPDDRPAEVVAAEIGALPDSADPGFEPILEFYRARAAHVNNRLRRVPFRTDSPVPASFFL